MINKLILKFKLWNLHKEISNVCSYLYCDGYDGKMCINYIKYLEKKIEIINEKIN